MELVFCHFLFSSNLVRTGSSVIIFLFLFDSVAHSSSSKYWVKYYMSISFSYVTLPPTKLRSHYNLIWLVHLFLHVVFLFHVR